MIWNYFLLITLMNADKDLLNLRNISGKIVHW